MPLTFDRPEQFQFMHLDLKRNFAEIKRRHGKSTLKQLIEMAPLVLAGNRISPSDYFRYQLYDDALYSAADRREFIGDNRYWEILFRISDWRSCTLTDDKLVSSALLATHGFRVPGIRAVFHPCRTYPGARALGSGKALGEFLRDEGIYPLFGKPLAGFESRGVVHLQGYDHQSDELLLRDDKNISVDDFVNELEKLTSQRASDQLRLGPGQGYIFQEVVKQHPDLETRCGESVCCLRVPVVVEASGPRLLNPALKIPAPGNIADNYWRHGNLMAGVDRENGKLTSLMTGAGVDLERFDDNPYTHEPLVGWTLPFFDEIKQAVLRGSTVFPGTRYQGWDVVITAEGPLIMEINNGSSFPLSQRSSGKGAYDAEFAEFVQWAESRNATAALMLSSRWRGRAHWLGPLHGAWLHFSQLFRQPAGG